MFSFQTIIDNLPVLAASARYTLLISGAGCLLGLIFGALAGGRIADAWGRRAGLVIALVAFGVFSIATAYTATFEQLVVMRFLTGVGLGGALPNLVNIAAESTDPANRGKAVSIMYAGIPLGGAIASGVSMLGLHGGDWHSIFLIGGILPLILVPFVLILKQPDLGTALLILASGAFVLFIGGLRWRWIIGAVTAVVPIAVAMWYFVLRDYQKQRVLTFLDPESDPLGTGWNIIQSKAAIGSGGVFGKGWLAGTQSHLDFLPESHTDFIIAVLAEEFGLVGVCLLLLVYILLITRGLVITVQAQTLFGKLLAGALTMTFFVYVFVNIGMVSGLLPVVGVPLPFISYGGTSLVTLLSGFGVLMSIHTHRKWIAQV